MHLRARSLRAGPARPRPALAKAANNGRDVITKQEGTKPVKSQDLAPQLIEQQEDAARSNNELGKLVAWASDLGNKAQQALAELQRSISGMDSQASNGAANGSGPSISDTMQKLQDVSDAIAESNAAFDAAIASAKSGGSGSNGNGAGASAAAEAMAAAAAVAAVASYDADDEAAAAAAADALAAVAAAPVAAAAAKAPATGSVKVSLAVTRETQLGQDVWVVGSAPALGGWDLDKALPLQWTEGHVWRASIEVDASEAATFEYKAVLKNGDGSAVWEAGDNKVADLAAAAAGELDLAHTFTA